MSFLLVDTWYIPANYPCPLRWQRACLSWLVFSSSISSYCFYSSSSGFFSGPIPFSAKTFNCICGAAGGGSRAGLAGNAPLKTPVFFLSLSNRICMSEIEFNRSSAVSFCSPWCPSYCLAGAPSLEVQVNARASGVADGNLAKPARSSLSLKNY